MGQVELSKDPSFKEELQYLLNKHSMDSRLNVPDFVLADFMTRVLVDMEHMNRDMGRWSGNEKVLEVSPYCVRCSKTTHGLIPHEFHETNEHDEWLERHKGDGNIS